MVGLFLSFIANVTESSGNEKSIVNILKQPLLEKKKKMFQIRKFCERARHNRTFENKL